jgi:ATP-dependent Clp protease ATP-binding subunit ClpC
MFERFTEKAIKVIMLAQEEARRLGHNFVGTEQILLGLIGEGTGIAAKVLKSMGINLKDARVEVEKIIGRGSGFVAVEIPFTPRAKRVLELSLEEARQLGITSTHSPFSFASFMLQSNCHLVWLVNVFTYNFMCSY